MRKNKLMISAITLAFAVVAVVSTTFAWFTMNTTNTVENMDFTATSGSGLYMSLDGTNYYTEITQDHLKAYAVGNTDIVGFKDTDNKLSPVTSLTVDSKEDLYDHNAEKATTGFVQFTLKFRSTQEVSVYVKSLNVSSKNNNTVSITYNKDNPADDSTDLYWKTKEGEAADGIYEFTTNLANAAKVKLAGTTTQFIDPNSTAGYKGISTSYSDSISHQYMKHISPDDATNIETKYDDEVKANVRDEYLEKANTAEALVTLAKTADSGDFYVGSVTVTLWIDGFDQDCFDVLFKQVLTFGLSFSTEATPAA